MSDGRLPPRVMPPPGGQFRCRACRRFVHAGPSGLCPGCGLGPPMPLLPSWAGARRVGHRVGYWLFAAMLSVALLAALVAVR